MIDFFLMIDWDLKEKKRKMKKIHVVALPKTTIEDDLGLLKLAKYQYSKLIKNNTICVCQILGKDFMSVGRLVDNTVLWESEKYVDMDQENEIN